MQRNEKTYLPSLSFPFPSPSPHQGGTRDSTQIRIPDNLVPFSLHQSADKQYICIQEFWEISLFLSSQPSIYESSWGYLAIFVLLPCPWEHMEALCLCYSQATSVNQYKGRWREKHWHVYSWFIELLYPGECFLLPCALPAKWFYWLCTGLGSSDKKDQICPWKALTWVVWILG